MQYVKICTVALLLLSLVSEPVNAQGTFNAAMAGRMGGGKSGPDKDPEIAKIATAIKWAAAGRIDPKAKEPAAIDGRGKYVFRTRADKQGEIDRLENELVILKLPVLSIPSPKEGEVGTLRFGLTTYRVLQIVGENSAMIEAEARVFGTGRVAAEWTFFLNSPTANLHEGQELKTIPGVWRIGAKRKYKMAFGAERMIHVLTPVPIEEALKATEKRTSPKVAPPPRDQPGRNPKTR